MRRFLAVGILAVTLFVVALPAANAGGTTYVTNDCVHARIKPASIVFACADGNWYVKQLSWSLWSETKATGKGVFHINDCKPSCAQGTFRTRHGSIVLTQRISCSNVGKHVFSHAAITYKKPFQGKTKYSTSLSCPTG